jgi:hypothetical protein
MEYIFSLERHTPFVNGILRILLMLKQINTLLEPEQIDDIVSWARTCKTILKICTKECETRLLVLLSKLNPNNTNLVLYKNHLRKWYLCKNSSTPLRWTLSLLLRWIVSLLLRSPFQKRTWVILPSCEFRENNITISYVKCRTLWLHNITNEELLSQTPNNEIHTLTLCDCPCLISFLSISDAFPSLIKLKLIRTRLAEKTPIRPSKFKLLTLSIIECDITSFELNEYMSWFKLQKLKWKNNIDDIYTPILITESVNYVSITHTDQKPLFIYTPRCGKEVFFK